jgi:hypothetical protein
MRTSPPGSDGRVEDERGSLGHAATLRFSSPLSRVEWPQAYMSAKQVLWIGFLRLPLIVLALNVERPAVVSARRAPRLPGVDAVQLLGVVSPPRARRVLYAEVTTRILTELERGAAPWVKPWAATPGQGVPQNNVSNRPYSG